MLVRSVTAITPLWRGGCAPPRPPIRGIARCSLRRRRVRRVVRGGAAVVAGMGAHELMELASNLGALDFTTGGPPAADWDINATVGRDGCVHDSKAADHMNAGLAPLGTSGIRICRQYAVDCFD